MRPLPGPDAAGPVAGRSSCRGDRPYEVEVAFPERTAATVPPGQDDRHLDMDAHPARLLAGKC
ncbi:hypothetical protein FCH28_11940 [Streptomyces piniterrae]|uniref:Uncharacterized protein n=2 Tax=Streptomyces piniterrae TaxID=2571125 RepID=A0A4U0NNS4_9ACTN|nr:hypothetical protein FCH28_11940 [Streptomyces piniterrae]